MANYQLTLNGNVLLFFICSIIIIWLSIFVYRRTNPPVPRRLKNVLIGLRSIALLLILFILFEPILRLSWNRSEPPEIAVLVDNSASMLLTDADSQRANVAKTIVTGLAEQYQSKDRILNFYQFANNLENLNIEMLDSMRFDNDGTDISNALLQVKNESVERNLAGAILITDGIDNLGENPVRYAEDYSVPIFPIAIGQNIDQKDVLVSKITSNQITYANNKVPVDVTVRAIGFDNQKLQIDLKQNDRVIDSKFVDINENMLETRIRLHYTPMETGLQKYSVEIPVQENELTPVNNRKSFYVNVLQSKMKILFISGGPDSDLSFLKKIIDDDPDSEAIYWILKNQRTFYRGAFPQNPDSLLKYDCIILHNFPRNSANTGVLNAVKNAFNKKAIPLFFIAGNGTYFRGLNSIDEFLPFRSTSQAGGEVLVVPQLTPQGLSHPVTRIDEEPIENQQKWQEMPPIYLSHRRANPHPGSEVLLQTDIDQTIIRGVRTPLPILIARKTTAHKSLGFIGYGLWRWDFLMWGIGKSNEEFTQFMHNSIRWLITKEDSKPVRITPDEKVYRNGQKITFTGEVYYEDYRPLDGADVKLKVFAGEKTLEISMTGLGEGKYEGSLPALEGGEYRYEGTASYKGRDLGKDSGQFSVEDFSLEYLQTKMNEPLLRQIADRSGGKYFTEENLAALDTLMNFPARTIPETREWELWNKLALLIIAIVLLSAEWFLRKRSGML